MACDANRYGCTVFRFQPGAAQKELVPKDTHEGLIANKAKGAGERGLRR